MNITTIELKRLTADKGKVLTNGDAYGTEIYLGKCDNPENWHEIAQEEYDIITKENFEEEMI
ncbi:MAG: hypothetical protein U0L72_05755 [Acutalibacteraceae bacterium]|nr:hypothetical protein [Acutalibacteraceae bacterium]